MALKQLRSFASRKPETVPFSPGVNGIQKAPWHHVGVNVYVTQSKPQYGTEPWGDKLHLSQRLDAEQVLQILPKDQLFFLVGDTF